jgi:signal transduction histidine kinase
MVQESPDDSYHQHDRTQASGLSVQETEQLVSELLATLGHELRTPLAAIKGYSSMLLRQDERLTPAERQAYLQVIQEAGQRLETLTTRVLDLTSLETGTFQVRPSSVDMLVVTRDVLAAVQQQLSETQRDRLRFYLHVRDRAKQEIQDVPPVKGDRRALRTVMEHLLENAVRFSPDGGRIDVIIQLVAPERAAHLLDAAQAARSWLEICVCDYGLGIPETDLARIFERFYRVDRSLTREVNGLGLGLAICHRLVALHQGQIWAESCSAGGSAFHLWLPLAEAVSSDEG